MWPRPTRPTAGSPTPTSYVQLTKTLAQHAREALDTLPKAAATEFCRPYDQLLRLVETQPATACSAPQGNGVRCAPPPPPPPVRGTHPHCGRHAHSGIAALALNPDGTINHDEGFCSI